MWMEKGRKRALERRIVRERRLRADDERDGDTDLPIIFNMCFNLIIIIHIKDDEMRKTDSTLS